MTANQPSIAQMKNRSTTGHRKALEAVRDGRPVLSPTALPSEYRGMRTVMATLRHWECINDAEITERGLALLAALRTPPAPCGTPPAPCDMIGKFCAEPSHWPKEARRHVVNGVACHPGDGRL